MLIATNRFVNFNASCLQVSAMQVTQMKLTIWCTVMKVIHKKRGRCSRVTGSAGTLPPQFAQAFSKSLLLVAMVGPDHRGPV